MTIDFDVHSLIQYLSDHQLQPQLQHETGQVFIVYNIQDFEVPLFFLLRPESDLLQTVAYLPYQLPEKTLPDVARMLHILNKELDMPGFGMDESQKLMFYRAVLPCFEKKIEKRLLNMCLGTTRIACDTFMNAIGVIVSGTMKLDDVLNDKKLKDT